MSVVIRFTSREETKALPILLCDRPGTILPDRTYVLRPETVAHRRAAHTVHRSQPRNMAPGETGVTAGERI